jgi:hypothetical protein
MVLVILVVERGSIMQDRQDETGWFESGGGWTKCERGKNQYQDGGVGNIIAEDSRFLGAWQLMPERVRVLDLICDMAAVACHLPCLALSCYYLLRHLKSHMMCESINLHAR